MSLAYWAMQLFKPPVRQVAPPPQAAQQDVHIDAAAALFGGRPAAVAVASNYQLRGVVMSGTPNESVAILSADGKPAQTVRANKEVAPGVTVLEVHPRYVVLSENGAKKRVELPEDAKNQMSMGTAPPLGQPSPAMPSREHGGNPMQPSTGAAPVLQASPESAPAQNSETPPPATQ
jgi:general secretion pathway protein C